MSLIIQTIDVLRHLVMVDVAIQGFYSHMVEQESKFDLSEVKCDPLGTIRSRQNDHAN